MPMVAWYVLSNESYMKRVIREVLPTEVIVRIAVRAFVSSHWGSRVAYAPRDSHTALFSQEDQPVSC